MEFFVTSMVLTFARIYLYIFLPFSFNSLILLFQLFTFLPQIFHQVLFTIRNSHIAVISIV